MSAHPLATPTSASLHVIGETPTCALASFCFCNANVSSLVKELDASPVGLGAAEDDVDERDGLGADDVVPGFTIGIASEEPDDEEDGWAA